MHVPECFLCMETTVEKKLGYYLNTEQAQFFQLCLLNGERYLVLE